MKLTIDTTDNLKTVLTLGPHRLQKTYSSPRDQDVIGALTQLLNTHSLKPTDITSIQVNPGPGSFTGIRVGVSIANTLAFALNLPINNQPPGSQIQPAYGKPPSITLSPKTTGSPADKK